MVFEAENCRPFGTGAKFSWTIYLQGPVVSIIFRNKLWEAAEIVIFYSMIRFKLTTASFKDLPPQILRPRATSVKDHS